MRYRVQSAHISFLMSKATVGVSTLAAVVSTTAEIVLERLCFGREDALRGFAEQFGVGAIKNHLNPCHDTDFAASAETTWEDPLHLKKEQISCCTSEPSVVSRVRVLLVWFWLPLHPFPCGLPFLWRSCD